MSWFDGSVVSDLSADGNQVLFIPAHELVLYPIGFGEPRSIPIVLQPLPPDAGVLDLARRLRLSIYDASYLELAVREGAPLATLDITLREAARQVKTEFWEPGKPGT